MMEVGQLVYCLIFGSHNQWIPIKGRITDRALDFESSDLFTKKYLYRVKLANGNFSGIPEKYVYPTKQMAQDAADHYNGNLIA